MIEFLVKSVLVVFCLSVAAVVMAFAPTVILWGLGLFVAYNIFCFLIVIASKW